MSDLEEKVNRGDILVDEVDVIDAIEKGRLSEKDGARFSAVLEVYSKLRGSMDSSFIKSGQFIRNA
ncbi:unnamed protein product [Gongylonema pulchrum]|uniref:Transcriptional regulator n=1 Tax=Gongylonema pulchrum TaxID=637853 RepID=A0A183D6Q5_9BILA|nr:unnamed protein product [Gongylonema pulchrum]